jgi:hypothetical protein
MPSPRRGSPFHSLDLTTVAYAFATLFVLAWVTALVALVIAFWNMVRVPFNLKPGVNAWAGGNPLNYLLKPEALTDKGIAARRRVGQALLIFLAACVAGAAIGLLAKWIA